MARRLFLSALLVAVCSSPLAAQTPPVGAAGWRFGFTQAATAAELKTYTWALFIDGARQPLPGVTCTAAATPNTFDCAVPIPAMTPGLHTIEFVTIHTEGTVVTESPKSTPFPMRYIGPPSAPTLIRIVPPVP